MNRSIRVLFSLMTLSLIILYGSSLPQALLLRSELLALGLIYLAILWIPESWWTVARHTLVVFLIISLVSFFHLSSPSSPIPESLLLIPLVLLLAREQERHQRYFVTLAVFTLVAMSLMAPMGTFLLNVLPIVIALYMSVRAINIYKAANRISLKHIEELNAAHQELQQTNAALQEATVHSMRYAALAERVRLAQDIHDGLGHELTSLIVQLQALEIMLPDDPGRAAKTVPGILDVARKAMAEVHQAVKTWREEETSDGLVALQSLIGQSAAHAPFTLSFQYDKNLSSWPVEVSVALYRILQEALTNVLRHAKASVVDVQVHEELSQVLLTVADDGCYSENMSLTPGYGINGMRERCQSLGGTFHTSLNTPHGLNIQVALPLKPSTMDFSYQPLWQRDVHE
jgi:signal transduction histidine kinase